MVPAIVTLMSTLGEVQVRASLEYELRIVALTDSLFRCNLSN